MFSRRIDPHAGSKSSSKGHKVSKSSSSFSKAHGVSKSRHEPRRRPPTASSSTANDVSMTSPGSSTLTPSIVTLVVGKEQRIFAAHEDVLGASPWFQKMLSEQYMDSQNSKRVLLPDEEPEIFSSVLEFLYKGDYYPRLVHNKRRNSWELEQPDEEGRNSSEATVYHHEVDGDLLKDTVIYCTADRYGLEELKRVALRKQGLHSKLRAHYLALIIRSRSTFKRSGTMQLEMYNGGTQLFFDLFVALCNHVDDISSSQTTPRSNRHFF
ncbi:hypothetical protein DL768_000503 [Monosporascus sp. mg162]|nr:hypothetical protein DL768_000503 [Monosporascus sp. mg162]